jgi:type IV pilus assembly protein PilV
MKRRISTRDAHMRQSGLSLLEVLIAIAVLAIGLLGLAHMQSFGLLNIERAYQRSQATVLAYAIADKMRANVTTANSYLTTFMDPAVAAAQPDCKTTSGCSVGALAENDLFEWQSELTSQLPGATGAITFADGNYTVAITWDDNGDGATDEDDPNFAVSFSL